MAEPQETTCTRCSTACFDHRRVGEERICIVCTEDEATRKERAACIGTLEEEAASARRYGGELRRQRGREVDSRTHLDRARFFGEAAKLLATAGRRRDGKR